MRRGWIGGVLWIVAIGCGSPANEAGAGKPKSEDPTSRLYESLRAGSFSLDAAQNASEEAILKAKDLIKDAEGEPKQTLLDIVELLDGVGAKIGDFTDPPQKAAVERDFAKQDDERLHAIDAASEALSDLGDTVAAVGLLKEGAPDDFKKDVGELSNQVDQAKDAVEEAIKQLGGKDSPEG